MTKEEIERLIDRFHSGEATDSDRKEIEQLLEASVISLEDIEEFTSLENQITRLEPPAPSAALDHHFYEMLSREKGRVQPSSWRNFFSLEFTPKLALASLTLILGIAAGYFLRSFPESPADRQILALSQQVSDLQELMMLSLLEKGSATERLKAVTLTQEMSDASRKVTDALIQTLNQDENVNVRLAALEALKPYATDSKVREALVRSIRSQESPLVQISLAELMVGLQEKSAVKEFEKIVESDKTPSEIKDKIRKTIRVLI
ncbi:MAG TPA: HEAT repeat domain-containing protein [Chryseosolibacter sp.]|nr:HEAT repeat domain-containing protein [Chryseosolibacter sp.]